MADDNSLPPPSAGVSQSEQFAPPQPRRNKRFFITVAVGILILAGVGYYWYSSYYETTDDAFIEGHIIYISARVPGHVNRVLIDDNQFVKQGDLLVEIDPRDYEARLAQARGAHQAAVARSKLAKVNVDLTQIISASELEQAQAGLETAVASKDAAQSRAAQAAAQVAVAQALVEQSRAEVQAAQASAKQADDDLKRNNSLFNDNVIPKQKYEYSLTGAQAAQANLEAARQKGSSAEAGVLNAQAAQKGAQDAVRQAQAQLQQARGRFNEANVVPQRNTVSERQYDTAVADADQLAAAVTQAQLALSYTLVTAPQDGRITRKTVEAGSYIQVGQPLLASIPQSTWVIANFKETQLTHMQIGQPVTIHVDAYPGQVFKAHIDSVQAGTGSKFSLLPPENATGNYVKIVQRVPVKIVFDDPPDPHYPLSPGMSVVPTVKIK
jgi:membrane fusion protein, multidrug efflux system